MITSLETFYFSPSNNDSTVATNVNCGVSNCSSCALHVLPDISWGTLDFPPHDYPILSGSSLSAESFPLSTHFNSVSPGYKMSTLITIVMMVTMMKAKMVQPSWFGSLGTFLRSAHLRLELKAMAIEKPELQPKAVHVVAVLL